MRHLFQQKECLCSKEVSNSENPGFLVRLFVHVSNRKNILVVFGCYCHIIQRSSVKLFQQGNLSNEQQVNQCFCTSAHSARLILTVFCIMPSFSHPLPWGSRGLWRSLQRRYLTCILYIGTVEACNILGAQFDSCLLIDRGSYVQRGSEPDYWQQQEPLLRFPQLSAGYQSICCKEQQFLTYFPTINHGCFWEEFKGTVVLSGLIAETLLLTIAFRIFSIVVYQKIIPV